jgi:CheY-like chemotaxis protein
MDGPTAITEIRKLGYSSIILGLTGNALLSDRDAMLKAGANGVLVKPLNLELFRDTLRVLSTKK